MIVETQFDDNFFQFYDRAFNQSLCDAKNLPSNWAGFLTIIIPTQNA